MPLELYSTISLTCFFFLDANALWQNMYLIWGTLASIVVVAAFLYKFVRKKKDGDSNKPVNPTPHPIIINGGGMTPEMQADYLKIRNERDSLIEKVKALESEKLQLVTNNDTANPRYGQLENDLEDLRSAIEKLTLENEVLKKERIESIKTIQLEVAGDAENDPLKAEAAKSLAEGNIENARSILLRTVSEDLLIAAKASALADAKRKESAATYFQLAEIDKEQLRYADALIHYRKAAELQPENPLYLNNLGLFQLNVALYDEALNTLGLALSLVEKQENNEGPTASILNNIGSTWRFKGEYDKAIEYYQSSLEIMTKFFDEYQPNIATTLNNIGLSWFHKGDYDEAIGYYQRSLDINIDFFGEIHQSTATKYNNLGLAWNAKGDFDKAIKYYQKALDIDFEIHEKNHPDLAVRYNNLGLAWSGKGDYDKARDYYQQSLDIELKLFGENHPNIATKYNNIGSILEKEGEYNEAIAYHYKALAIDKKIFGEEHPDVAPDYHNLGFAYQSKGEYDKAISNFEKALSIMKKFHPNGHPNIRLAEKNLASAKSKLSQS